MDKEQCYFMWGLNISGVFVAVAIGLYAQCVIAPPWA